MPIYVVTGTPGVGKSLVLSKAIEKNKGKFKIISYGSVMLEVAQQMNLADNRDKLRYISKEDTDKLRREVAKKITEEEGSIILDTHCSIETPQGYAPGLPQDVLTTIKPEIIVLIEGRPDEIMLRRQGDQERGIRIRSDFGGINDVVRHQDINRAYAAAYSAISGCPIAVILNEQGKVEEAAKKLRKVLNL